MGLGARIKLARQSLDWSQSDLAAKVGTSQTCVHNWEADNTYPRPDNLAVLSKVLNMSPEYLEEDRDSLVFPSTVEQVLVSAKIELARVLQTKAEKIVLTFSMTS